MTLSGGLIFGLFIQRKERQEERPRVGERQGVEREINVQEEEPRLGQTGEQSYVQAGESNTHTH